MGAVRVRGRNAGPGIPYRAPKTKKPWYKRWWVWVIAVILVWVFFSNLGGGGSSGGSSTDMRGADSQAANALTAEAQQSAREAAEAAAPEAAAAAEAAAAEKAAAEKAAAEKEAADKAAAEAAAPAVTKPAGPTDAERSAILEARLREIFGEVDSMSELLSALPGASSISDQCRAGQPVDHHLRDTTRAVFDTTIDAIHFCQSGRRDHLIRFKQVGFVFHVGWII